MEAVLVRSGMNASLLSRPDGYIPMGCGCGNMSFLENTGASAGIGGPRRPSRLSGGEGPARRNLLREKRKSNLRRSSLMLDQNLQGVLHDVLLAEKENRGGLTMTCMADLTNGGHSDGEQAKSRPRKPRTKRSVTHDSTGGAVLGGNGAASGGSKPRRQQPQQQPDHPATVKVTPARRQQVAPAGQTTAVPGQPPAASIKLSHPQPPLPANSSAAHDPEWKNSFPAYMRSKDEEEEQCHVWEGLLEGSHSSKSSASSSLSLHKNGAAASTNGAAGVRHGAKHSVRARAAAAARAAAEASVVGSLDGARSAKYYGTGKEEFSSLGSPPRSQLRGKR